MSRAECTLPLVGDGAIASGDGLCGVDCEQRIVIWNTAAETLLGYKRSEVQGQHCFKILRATDDAGRRVCRHGCANFTCAVQRKPVAARTLRTRTKLGETIWLSVHSILLPAPWCDRAVLIHLFRDMSRLKRIEISVQQLLEKDGVAFDSRDDVDSIIHRANDASAHLTSREREVLSLLASGTSTLHIAETLGVSAATVRNHIGHILRKLRVHTRLEAVASAVQHGLL